MGSTSNRETRSSARPAIRRKEQTNRLRKKEKIQLKKLVSEFNLEPVFKELGDLGKW